MDPSCDLLGFGRKDRISSTPAFREKRDAEHLLSAERKDNVSQIPGFRGKKGGAAADL